MLVIVQKEGGRKHACFGPKLMIVSVNFSPCKCLGLYENLCQRVNLHVGESQFRSYAYISAFLIGKSTIYDTNIATAGNLISGEVKTAITLSC